MSGITDPAQEYFKDGLWGWGGSNWRKLPLLWGYSDRWAERQSDINASAGENTLYTDAVPAGYVYVLNFAVCHNVNTACSYVKIYLYTPGVYPTLVKVMPAGVDEEVFWGGDVKLKEGDRVGGCFGGCNAWDDIYLDVWGYKMKIAE